MMTLVLRLSNNNRTLRLLTLMGVGGALIAGVCATPAAADVITGTDAPTSSQVKTTDAAGWAHASFAAYSGSVGGVRVASGNVNGAGPSDIITGAGPGGNGHVKVFDGGAGFGLELWSFFAYGPSFTGGIFVGGGDANNDTFDDIVTGVDVGFAPHVKVFSGASGAELRSFFAFDAGFTGGVRVATGDVDGDGFADIITGAGAAGGGHVKVFSGATGAELRSFFAYGPSYSGGVFVGGGDVNNDGVDDVITGTDTGAGPHVKVFSGANGSELYNFFPYEAGFTGGVRVAGDDVNGDGFTDIITGPGIGGVGHVKVISGATGALLQSFLAFGPQYTGGIFVASGTTVPEPSGAALLLGSVAAVIARRRR